MAKVFFLLCCILTSTFTGGKSTPSFSTEHLHVQVPVNDGPVVIEFEGGKVSISQPEDSGCSPCNKINDKLASTFEKTKSFTDDVTEVIGEAVGKAGEKAVEVIRKAKAEVGKTTGSVTISDCLDQGTLKDAVVKLEEWDPVDSPKRIGEDIGHNASVKIEQGVEEVKETVENVMETSPDEVITRSKNAISDVLIMVSSMRSVISWWHLIGFSIAYGMGVWVTFFSGSLLGKCLPKQQCAMVLSKMNMVYFSAMGYSVGVALFGFLVSQGRGVLSNKMEMFQGFNLVCALVMVLTNLTFLEPLSTKYIFQRMKETVETKSGMKETVETKSVAAEKLKKINAYSSTLNVSTMVVLTWHVAYIGQLLQARH